MRQITVQQMQEILRKNGFELERQKGSHQIWSKPGANPITIPCVRLRCVVALRLIKENNLQI